jgi:hypothetical protein
MKIARGCQLNFAFGSIARVRMQQELYEAFMIGSFFGYPEPTVKFHSSLQSVKQSVNRNCVCWISVVSSGF